MRAMFLSIFLIFSLFSQMVEAKDKLADDDYDNYIELDHVPSKGRFYSGEPPIKLRAETSSNHAPEDFQLFFLRAKKIANNPSLDNRRAKSENKITVSNAVTFHGAFTRMEIGFQKETITLYYTGQSKLPELQGYDREWLILYKDIFNYITSNSSYTFTQQSSHNH